MSKDLYDKILDSDELIGMLYQIQDWAMKVKDAKLREAYLKSIEDMIETRADEAYQDQMDREPPDFDDDYHGEDKGYK